MNNTGLNFQLVVIRDSYYYTVGSNDVKVLKSRWNFVKTKTTTQVTIFTQLSAASVLIQQNQHGDMASFAEALYKAPTKSERNLFFCEGRFFNSHSEQCSNTCTHVCMAVLIRCVTCKCLFYFWGQRKVLSCEIYLPALRPCFFHGGALVFFWTATKSLTFLNNFQVNLHFTRYAQGKYVIERKFMYL